MLDKLKGYKTYLWNAWPMLAIMLAHLGLDAKQIELLVTEYYAYAVAVFTAGGVFLRSITDSPPPPKVGELFKKAKNILPVLIAGIFLLPFLGGCAGTVTTKDGQKIPAKAYVAAKAASNKTECYKNMGKVGSGIAYTPDQVAALSASAQAKYFDYQAELERNAPLVEMAAVLKSAFGKSPCQDEAAIAYFDSEKEKYRQIGNTTGKAFDLALMGWLAKMAKETVTGLSENGGDNYTTNVDGVELIAGPGGGEGGNGGGIAANFGGIQGTDGSTVIKGNNNVPYLLRDNASIQQSEKLANDQGVVNDQQDGQGAGLLGQ